jgi:Zn-finger nucleic acid-binding protein
MERQGVEVDVCPECWGIWLDRGELEKLAERMAEPGRDEPRLWSDRRLREPVAGRGRQEPRRRGPRPRGSFAAERARVRQHHGGAHRGPGSLLQELLDLRG